MRNPNLYSGRALAFLGDAVWSLLVRDYLLEKGEGKGKTLQKMSISYVSAKAQASFYAALHEEGFFTEEEETYYHRGRNGYTGTVPKNTAAGTYRMSTGFEAILGALYLKGDTGRIRTIWDKVRTKSEE
jgi:ribonuclease-3 family protein